MQVEFEPRSDSFRVWCSNQDDYNFMKLVQSPAFDPYKFLKNYQNSIYGKMVSDMGIDGKENNKMIKGLDYILIHVDKEPVIIFKKQIVSISKDEDRAYILCTRGDYYSDESYADIVKQAL